MWGDTQTQFTKQYAKERRKLEHEQVHKNYEISAAFQEATHPNTIKTPYGEATSKTADNSFTAAMEHAAALE